MRTMYCRKEEKEIDYITYTTYFEWVQFKGASLDLDRCLLVAISLCIIALFSCMRANLCLDLVITSCHAKPQSGSP